MQQHDAILYIHGSYIIIHITIYLNLVLTIVSMHYNTMSVSLKIQTFDWLRGQMERMIIIP